MLRINSNIEAMNAHRSLMQNAARAGRSMEKLSSGLRINRAADDSAGLAISEKMLSQVRGLNQAMRNAQDGISLIQTAEMSLSESHNVLQRMRELAVQAANDTLTPDDRNSIQMEINNLIEELDRIGNETEFNTMKLLMGDLGGAVRIVEGDINDCGMVPITRFDVTGTIGGGVETGYYELLVEAEGTHDIWSTNVTDGNQATKSLALQLDATTALGMVAGEALTVSQGGKTLAVVIDGDMKVGDLIAVVNDQAHAAGMDVVANVRDVGGDGDDWQFYIGSTEWGTDNNLNVTAGAGFANDHGLGQAGTDATLEIWDMEGNTDTVYVTSSVFNITNATLEGGSDSELLDKIDGLQLYFGPEHQAGNEMKISIEGDNFRLQIGANQGQTMNISIGDMRASALGTSATDQSQFHNLTELFDNGVGNQANAEAAITLIDDAIRTVSVERSNLGAFQNRLEHTIGNLGVASENLSAAESRIRDVDMAYEMMEFTKNQILQQAGIAMLAQANVAPQAVLQLLG